MIRVDLEGGTTSSFQQMLNEGKTHLKKFAGEVENDLTSSWQGIGKNLVAGISGMAGFEALKGHLEELFERGNQIKDMSEQFDMTTDSVQRWEKALGKANMTFGVFARAIETLRAKRQSARENDKDLGAFSQVGISEEEVRGNMTDEQLLMKVLGSGAGRGQIGDLVGRRGTRLKAAMEYYDSEGDVEFKGGDIQSLHKTEQEWKELKLRILKFSLEGGPGRSAIGVSQLLGGEFKEAFKSFFGLAMGGASVISPGFGLLHKAGGMLDGYLNKKLALNGDTSEKPEPDADPELALKHKLKEEKVEKSIADEQLRQFEFQSKMNEEQRGHMTHLEKRLSIEKDLARIREMVMNIDAADPALRDSLKGQKDSLLLRYQSLTYGQREKQMSFTPDSLAHIGLFGLGSMANNPVLGVQQEQLEVMKRIERNTKSATGDAYAP